MLDKIFRLEEQEYSESDAEWDEFVAQHPHGSLLQTTAWASLKSKFGWSPQRVWLRKDGQLVGGAQMLVRSYALGFIKMGYVPHGPLINWADPEQVEVMMYQLDRAAFQNRAAILKMEPLIWQDEMPDQTWQTISQQNGLQLETDTIQPPRTMLIDLRPSEDEIMEAMKQKTRYNIRLSAKKEVTIRQGTADDLPFFARMMHITGARNEFGVHASEYYRDAHNLFAPEHCALFLAEYAERPLAAVMAFAYGNYAYNLFSASTNEERQRMPSYGLQWTVMRWAKERGCHYYDLWGVPDATPDELEARFQEREDGLWGVYRFKRGFNGQIRRTVGAADRVYNNFVYKLYQRRRQA